MLVPKEDYKLGESNPLAFISMALFALSKQLYSACFRFHTHGHTQSSLKFEKVEAKYKGN